MSTRLINPPWKESEEKLFLRLSDQEIARKLCRSVSAVKRKRQRLGIKKPRENLFTDREKRLLGTMRDEKLAKKLGRALITIHRWRAKLGIPCFASKARHWEPRELRMLGRLPDRVVAKRLNRDLATVRSKRFAISGTKLRSSRRRGRSGSSR